MKCNIYIYIYIKFFILISWFARILHGNLIYTLDVF
jgi:hypothetical protein